MSQEPGLNPETLANNLCVLHGFLSNVQAITATEKAAVRSRQESGRFRSRPIGRKRPGEMRGRPDDGPHEEAPDPDQALEERMRKERLAEAKVDFVAMAAATVRTMTPGRASSWLRDNRVQARNASPPDKDRASRVDLTEFEGQMFLIALKKIAVAAKETAEKLAEVHKDQGYLPDYYSISALVCEELSNMLK